VRFLRRVPAAEAGIPLPAVPGVRPDVVGLPGAGPLRVGDVALPAGRPVAADPSFAPETGTPALWITEAVVPDAPQLWRRLVDEFPASGLWPLLLCSLDGDDRRPWDTGELAPLPVAEVDAVDAAQVLAAGWAEGVAVEGDPMPAAALAPFDHPFPGLAPSLPRVGTPAAVPAGALAPGAGARLGLVPCRRPADAVALVGWDGAVNVTGPAEVSAVLRSWEDRWGVVLAGLDFDTVTLVLAHPPQDAQQALRMAAEVAALCPDALWQVPEDTFEGMVRNLVRQPLWQLWFD
jgi:hypothetical protein